jgi:hypothetical protein
MKQQNTDNRQEQTAQQLREKSAFINQVTSFAEYMKKEFTDDSDGDLGLIICAADHTADERTGACHIVLGGRAVNVASLASMMQQDEMQDLFRKARILSSTDGSNGYMADELRRLRRRMRWTYGAAAFCALWTLALIALQFIFGGSWMITVCSVLLMLATDVNLAGQVLDLRRKTRRLADSIDGDRRERRNMLGAAMMGFLAQMAHRDRDDDDEE